MADIRSISSSDDFADLVTLSATQPVMLLKHSTRCPVSSFAHQAFLSYASDASARGVVLAMVLVVEDRAVSLEIAEKLAVPHQSPQAILIREGRPVWNASHEGVNVSALADAERQLAV